MRTQPHAVRGGLALGRWILLAVSLAAGCREGLAPAERPQPVQRTPVERLRLALDSIRLRYQLPALGAALVRLDSAPLIAAAGVRRWGSTEAVSDSDAWHLGSNTKAFAATELAFLVQRGQLRWDIPLDSLFPELAATMRPEYRQLTLSDVLAHRAGLVRDVYGDAAGYTDPRAARERAMPQALAAAPVGPAGQFVYSNIGYVLAGAVAERRAGRAWEELIRRDLFEPLGLRSATFDCAPGQPRPHQAGGGAPTPLAWDWDNPPVYNSAGRLHITLADWSRFALLHLRGERGIDDVLPAARIAELHRPWHGIVGGNGYNAGWWVSEDWPGRVLQHGGTNGANFSMAWLAPDRGFALLAVTNVGGDNAPRAVSAVFDWLIAYLRAGGGASP